MTTDPYDALVDEVPGDYDVVRLADGSDESAADRLRAAVRSVGGDRGVVRSLLVDLREAGAVSAALVDALVSVVHTCHCTGRFVVIAVGNARVAGSLRAVGLHRVAAVLPSSGAAAA